ncbi:MAG: D-glycero-beta-D-manno-heptose 1,7-bisphosphate 7-phosphatase [Cellvibrionaceae bacterium]
MPLVILDRDGVINVDSDAYIKNAEEWIAIPGSLEAIAKLSTHGFTVVVATNQSGIARGLFDLDDLEAMHTKLQDGVAELGGNVAGIFYCPHGPDENCECRKPGTALLTAIENEIGLPVAGAPFIGDSLKDLQAGIEKGCLPYLVKTGKGKKTLNQLDQLSDDSRSKVQVFSDLSDAVNAII